ncbi:MAG: helix-turn-helix transcriptional regulator [Clostridia bacterium]|nr:helix-turn-helix transcriptional regulator [Clostridia bacterium]
MDYGKIGAFIANERKQKNMSQIELAEELCVSPKTVSKWETGRGLPETAILTNLCVVLKISLNELLSGERLTTQQYVEQAEENMTTLLKQTDNEHSAKVRKTTYYALTAVQVVLAILSTIFVLQYLAMTGQSNASILAVAFSIAFVVVYFVQFVVVFTLRRKTLQTLPVDNLFLIISILLLPLVAVVCWIMTALFI